MEFKISVEMELVTQTDINPFHDTARILIGGVSYSGKSHFVGRLLKYYEHLFEKIYVIGSDLEGIENLNVTRDDTFDPFDESHESDTTGHKLIVLDDILNSKSKLKLACKLFSYGRHKNYSVILITQNIFLNDPNFRTCSLNASFCILFRVRDLLQIKHFCKSFLADNQIESFISLYKKLVLRNKFGYLCIDFKSGFESKIRIRSNILQEGNEYMKAYKI